MPDYYDDISKEVRTLDATTQCYLVALPPQVLENGEKIRYYALKAISEGIDQISQCPTSGKNTYWPIDPSALLARAFGACTNEEEGLKQQDFKAQIFPDDCLIRVRLTHKAVITYLGFDPIVRIPKIFNSKFAEEQVHEKEDELTQDALSIHQEAMTPAERFLNGLPLPSATTAERSRRLLMPVQNFYPILIDHNIRFSHSVPPATPSQEHRLMTILGQVQKSLAHIRGVIRNTVNDFSTPEERFEPSVVNALLDLTIKESETEFLHSLQGLINGFRRHNNPNDERTITFLLQVRQKVLEHVLNREGNNYVRQEPLDYRFALHARARIKQMAQALSSPERPFSITIVPCLQTISNRLTRTEFLQILQILINNYTKIDAENNNQKNQRLIGFFTGVRELLLRFEARLSNNVHWQEPEFDSPRP